MNLTDANGMAPLCSVVPQPSPNPNRRISCDCCTGIQYIICSSAFINSLGCLCDDTPTPPPSPTPITPTPPPPSPTPITPTPSPTPAACPSDSLFGCYPGTTTPIRAAWIPNTHPGNTAADFVPEGAPSGQRLDWERVSPYNQPEYRTVHAVVGGEVLTNLHSLGDGNFRIRTEQTITVAGQTFSKCYEYLHLEPLANSPASGTLIGAGTPLGIVENWEVDRFLPADSNNGPSHVHVAIYPCRADDPQMSLAGGQGSQLDPLAEMNHVIGR